MARLAKTIGTVAAGVALVATGIGAVGGLGIIAAGAATKIGAIASLVSGVANIGSQALAKPPAARGSVSQLIISPDAPQPYVMGEGYFAGVLRQDTGYGGEVGGVDNPYKFWPVVYSGGGPVESITPWVDFGPVPTWYDGYLYTDTQLGACPEADALSPQWSGAPGWDSSSKLSGQAAIGWSFKFDKKGKRFAGGIPPTGAYGQWVKVYDPRLDSTFPGGSGAHRLGDEDTYEWSANPALHAGTYAYGRYQNGLRTFGLGLPADGIDWEVVAAWANVCDANGWTMFGVAFEPGDRKANLRDICIAGGAEPVPGGIMSFKYSAPRVALATITEADLAAGPRSVRKMQSLRDRPNTGIAKYRSPDHSWELVDAQAVQVAAFLADDGEPNTETPPLNFVTDVDQATELMLYRIYDGREQSPIVLTLKPQWRTARPGECYHVTLPRLNLDIDAVVLKRAFDPVSMTVTLTLMGETASKHAAILGATGTAPPLPATPPTAQERDETAANAADKQIAIEVPGVRNYAADSSGTIQAGLLPDYIVPGVKLGGTDVRTEDEAQYSLATSNVSATVDSTDGSADKGTITITALSGKTGYVDFIVTWDSKVFPAKRIVVQRQDAFPTSSGGSGSKSAADASLGTVDDTSFVAISDILTVTLATGETLTGTAPLGYHLEGTTAGSRTVTAKWQHSPAGAGTWTDFDTGDVVGSAATGGVSPEDGYGDFNDSAAGLTAGDYDVQLVAKLDASGRTVSFNGTAAIVAG